MPKQDLKKNVAKKQFVEDQEDEAVKLVRKARLILSKQKIDLDEINNL